MDWVAKNVKLILENQVYLGHMVLAMIDEETFALVQKFINIKKRPNKMKKPNMFVGFVKCPTCERNMALSGTLEKGKWLCCRTYTRNTSLCTSHIISFEAL